MGGVDGAGVGLERDLRVRRDVEALAQRGDDDAHLGQGQQAGRAAAEEHGLGLTAGELGRPERRLAGDGGGIGAHERLLAGVGVEVAIGALGGAERYVDVEGKGLSRHKTSVAEESG